MEERDEKQKLDLAEENDVKSSLDLPYRVRNKPCIRVERLGMTVKPSPD